MKIRRQRIPLSWLEHQERRESRAHGSSFANITHTLFLCAALVTWVFLEFVV